MSVILALAVRLYPGGRGASLPAPLPGDLGPREGLHVALELHAAPGAGGHLLHRHVDQWPDWGEGKVEIFQLNFISAWVLHLTSSWSLLLTVGGWPLLAMQR